MSLLLLFQGGGAGVDIPPPVVPDVVALAFLPHGTAAVGPGAHLAIGPDGGVAFVQGAPSTEIGGGHTAIVGTGAKTTIQ
jgi:hypothetical protein